MSGGAGHAGGEDVVGVVVEVLACSVVAHGGAWGGVSGGDLDVAQVDAGAAFIQPDDHNALIGAARKVTGNTGQLVA